MMAIDVSQSCDDGNHELFFCRQGYLVSPFLAYNFSELIESHAVDTYTEFAEANRDLLKSLPPPPQVLYPRTGERRNNSIVSPFTSPAYLKV